MEEQFFLSNSDLHHLVAFFIGAFKNLASQNEAKIKNLFLDIKTTVKIELGGILEKLTQRPNPREQVSLDDFGNKHCASTQFLQIQKNQLIDLEDHLEQFCKVLPVFGFKISNYDISFMKSFLPPVLVFETQESEPVHLVLAW